MSLLPKNEPTEKDITPKVFFIWGQSMHGKTYLARQFPEPIILNTDSNGKKTTTPHVEINDFETFVTVLKEIEEGKHTFKTIVIDLVDDIKTFLEDYVCKKYQVENLADAPFGKAFSDVRATWKRLMIRLTQLPYTVIFISHIIQVTDEYDKNTTIEQPSLEQKFLNMTKGRTDVMIKCQKIGNTYLQICNEKRDNYKMEDIKDPAILKAVKDVKKLFDSTTTTTEVKPMKKLIPQVETTQEEIVELKESAVIVPTEESNVEEIKPIEVDIKATTESILKKKSLLFKKEEE